jgi:hypothetical protein
MYTKDQLNDLYERIVKTIDISNEMFDVAEKEYKELGNWIDQATPQYKIHIYSQGSFALGTVVKPIEDSEDYDLDLVCEFEQQYGLSARSLKCDVVKPLLERYKKATGDIENKRRCWHVEYEDIPNFHMDIIPAVNRGMYIDITDHDEESDTYDYIGSNPLGYIEWFKGKKAERRKILLENYCLEHSATIKCSADIDVIKEYHLKTPLQKAIQILKRHRDVMFKDDTLHRKPISIIITTIAAELYQNEDNIVDTLTNILENAESYIKKNMIGSEYHIDNPTYTGPEKENFADKWNAHSDRADAFFEWLKKAKEDLVDKRVYGMFRTQLAENFTQALGTATTQRVFTDIAKEDRAAIENQTKKIVTSTGAISTTGSVSIPRSHHYGK